MEIHGDSQDLPNLSDLSVQENLMTQESQKIQTFLDLIRYDEEEGLNAFLANNPNWNAAIEDEETGNTALHYASANGFLHLVSFLLERGAFV